MLPNGFVLSDTLKWLVVNGADVKVKSVKGRTALDMAKSIGMSEIITYLKTCGM